MIGRSTIAPEDVAELTAVGLSEPQIRRLAQLGPARIQQLARLHEIYPSLASDVLTPDIQRKAFLRWSRHRGRTA